MITGKSKIELTNITTGQVETYTDHNMVTNALANVLGWNPKGRMAESVLTTNFLPLYKHALGGILLFDQTLTESPDNMIPPGDANCIGHAGDSAYGGHNSRRGSFNDVESSLTDNGMKLVWDFGTSQGNGTIKSVCLTSAKGGTEGLGFAEDYNTINGEGTSVNNGRLLINLDVNESSYDYNLHTTTYRFGYSMVGEALHIKKYLQPCASASLTADAFQGKLVAEYDVQIAKPYPDISAIRLANQGNYLTIDYAYNSSAYFYLIDPNTGAVIKSYNIKEYAGITPYSSCPTVMLGDYLYITETSGKQIIKIHKDDPTNKVVISSDAIFYSGVVVGNRIYYKSNQVIDANNQVLHFVNGFFPNYARDMVYTDELRTIHVTGGRYIYYGIYAPYLATINNLAAPIEKTAEKTMKITYELTEGGGA